MSLFFFYADLSSCVPSDLLLNPQNMRSRSNKALLLRLLSEVDLFSLMQAFESNGFYSLYFELI